MTYTQTAGWQIGRTFIESGPILIEILAEHIMPETPFALDDVERAMKKEGARCGNPLTDDFRRLQGMGYMRPLDSPGDYQLTDTGAMAIWVADGLYND